MAEAPRKKKENLPGNGGQFAPTRKPEAEVHPSDKRVPEPEDVLASAARLQEMVPDAVLVGGSAAAYHARHRLSADHDHVVTNLRERFDMVLDALESDPDFVFNRATPGKIILGSLGDIEVGIRQLIRERPVEFEDVELPDGKTVRVPTMEEILRIKAYLVVKRNQVRDYLDVAALSDAMGAEKAAMVLAGIDAYYTDPKQSGEPVRSQVTRQLGNPRPKDTRTIDELSHYKGLVPRWHDWADVVSALQSVGAHMVELEPHRPADTGGN